MLHNFHICCTLEGSFFLSLSFQEIGNVPTSRKSMGKLSARLTDSKGSGKNTTPGGIGPTKLYVRLAGCPLKINPLIIFYRALLSWRY